MESLTGKLTGPLVACGTLASVLLAAASMPLWGTTAARAASPDWTVPRAAPSVCEFGSAYEAGPGWPMDPTSARLLAGVLLSAQETVLGIRPDQAQAWRAYTSALIDLIPTGERLARWTDKEKAQSSEAFDFAQDVASAAIERGERARRLQQAVAALKPLLSPDQMRMAKQMQERLVQRIAWMVEMRRTGGVAAPN